MIQLQYILEGNLIPAFILEILIMIFITTTQIVNIPPLLHLTRPLRDQLCLKDYIG